MSQEPRNESTLPVSVHVTCAACHHRFATAAPPVGESVDIICLHCHVQLEVYIEGVDPREKDVEENDHET